jgi:hypothetical protein
MVLCGLLLGGCAKSSAPPAVYTGPPLNDTEFAKEVFRRLAAGDQEVTAMIDWENLNMLGVDVGAMYRGISAEGSARSKFIQSFLNGYSKSFKEKGGNIENSSNWREQSRDATNTVIAADGLTKQVLLMTVTHKDGHQKVSKIELK